MHEKSAGCNRAGEYTQSCTFAPKQDGKQIPDPLRRRFFKPAENATIPWLEFVKPNGTFDGDAKGPCE